MDRCECCGRKLRRDEGKVCRFCAGEIRKQLNAAIRDWEKQLNAAIRDWERQEELLCKWITKMKGRKRKE